MIRNVLKCICNLQLPFLRKRHFDGNYITCSNYYKTTAKCCIWTPGPRFLPSDHWSQMLLQCLVDVESLHMYGFFRTYFSSSLGIVGTSTGHDITTTIRWLESLATMAPVDSWWIHIMFCPDGHLVPNNMPIATVTNLLRWKNTKQIKIKINKKYSN